MKAKRNRKIEARAGRIESLFARLREERRAALVIYATACDPDRETSVGVFGAALGGGADMVEIGMAFSDPAADGPAIQAASARALAAGATVAESLRVAAGVREGSEAPIVLFGYLNPILAFGVERFAEEAAGAGADGVLVVDMPPEEDEELGEALERHGVRSIRLVAPTSTGERIRLAAERGSGFLYFVSVAGVTGAGKGNAGDVARQVGRIRKVTGLPVAVGFGVTTAEDAEEMARVSDGVVVGSAVVRLVEAHGKDAAGHVEGFVRTLREGVERGKTGQWEMGNGR